MTSIYLIWAVYAFSIVFLLPTVYLTVGVGWAYSRVYQDFFLCKLIMLTMIESVLYSTAVTTFCMNSSALAAFLLGRYIFRSCVTKQLQSRYPNFKIYNQAIKKEGIRFVFLMQFSLIPYSLSCYLFGLTRVTLIQFMVGVTGMALPNFFWSYVGSLLQSITDYQN